MYREIARASQETLGLSVVEYVCFLQSCWEELTQYEHLSDFLVAVATIVSQRLVRQHTYLFLMGLNSEYESLRIQILNTPSYHPYMRPLLLLMETSCQIQA